MDVSREFIISRKRQEHNIQYLQTICNINYVTELTPNRSLRLVSFQKKTNWRQTASLLTFWYIVLAQCTMYLSQWSFQKRKLKKAKSSPFAICFHTHLQVNNVQLLFQISFENVFLHRVMLHCCVALCFVLLRRLLYRSYVLCIGQYPLTHSKHSSKTLPSQNIVLLSTPHFSK